MFCATLRCHTGQQVQYNLPQVKATFVVNKILCILVLGFPQVSGFQTVIQEHLWHMKSVFEGWFKEMCCNIALKDYHTQP